MTEFYNSPDTEDLITDHQLFVDALDFQFEVDQMRFPTYKEAYRYARDRLYQLEQRAHKEGFIEQPVVLSGLNISLPGIAHNPRTGMESIIPVRVNTSEEPDTKTPPVGGLFYGFHPVIIDADLETNSEIDADADLEPVVRYYVDTVDRDEDDNEHKPEAYRVVVHYRVGISENALFTNAMGGLCALGNITCTHLQFRTDQQNEKSILALNSLADVSHIPEAVDLTIKIDELLKTKRETNTYGQNRYKLISKALREHEMTHGVDTRYRDGLIDLVQARLGIQENEEYFVTAISALTLVDGEDFITDSIQSDLSVLGLAFAPHYNEFTKGPVFYGESESLALVVGVNTGEPEYTHGYIPFDKLVSLKRSD